MTPMESREVYWEIEARVVFDCWVRLPLGDGESFRFDCEEDARDARDEFHHTGREARLVRVVREVIGVGEG
jgi:hypothetical protein